VAAENVLIDDLPDPEVDTEIDIAIEVDSNLEQISIGDESTEVASSLPSDNQPEIFNTIVIDESVPMASRPSRGRILREWWSEISGDQVADLTSHPTYPDQPTDQEYLAKFEAPKSVGNAYGARIRGYLHPPTTGYYRLWIACDDTGELLLSTDELSANATLRAFCSDWTHSRQWNLRPEQRTGQVFLEAGQRYYIEALHKEGGLKDNLSVAWQIPEQTQIAVIDGAYLSPFK